MLLLPRLPALHTNTHTTGGLRDTVLDFQPFQQTGTGWTFDNCDASGLMHATGLALHTLREHPKDFEVRGGVHVPVCVSVCLCVLNIKHCCLCVWKER